MDLSKDLLAEGYEFILSEKLLCQDPLEQYFSKQRNSTGGNNNPSMAEVVGYNRLHNVCQSVEVDLKGNCSKREGQSTTITNDPLPKRPRKKNH